MDVKVGPAKRAGYQRTILNQPLQQVAVRLEGDGVLLSFSAAGMYDLKSQYRYQLSFSRDELAFLLSRKKRERENTA